MHALSHATGNDAPQSTETAMHSRKIIPLVTFAELAELKTFYVDRLGFELTYDAPMYLGLKSPGEDGAEIGFMTPDSDTEPVFEGKGLTLCLYVDDVDATHSAMVERDVPIVQPPEDKPWGDRCCVARDPAGVMLYVTQPIPAQPEFQQYVP